MYTRTTNNEMALESTGDANVDLFFNIGSARFAQERIAGLFDKAVKKNSTIAAAVLAWSRDIRKGSGERATYRNLLSKLIEKDEHLAGKLIDMTPELGRYDDLRTTFDTPLERRAVDAWVKGLNANNELAYKWVNVKKDWKLRGRLNMTKEKFRKYIAKGRPGLVEHKMCNKKWNEIEYDKVPSVCMKKSSKAFDRNDHERFNEWKGDDTSKANSAVLYPYQVYQLGMVQGDKPLANKMWKNMKMELSGNILPIVDVSSSMNCEASKGVSCMSVAVSLGVYLAQNNTGPFKNKLINFSNKSEIIQLSETNDICDIFNNMLRLPWGGSTNFESAYQNILDEAIAAGAKQKDMPEYLVVLSDMQFNQAQGSGYYGRKQVDPFDTAYDKMKKTFEAQGYKIPKVIYWNLNAAHNNVPVEKNTEKVALVSGFSPNIMASILKADLDCMTPKAIMMETIKPYLDVLM